MIFPLFLWIIAPIIYLIIGGLLVRALNYYILKPAVEFEAFFWCIGAPLVVLALLYQVIKSRLNGDNNLFYRLIMPKSKRELSNS